MAMAIAINVVLGVVLLALLGLRRSPDGVRLASPEEALALFQRHFPEAQGRATLSSDARGALLELEPGGLGVLVRDGRRWNARIMTPRDLASVRSVGDHRLEIRFRDFAWPRVRLEIDDPALRAAWVERLEGVLLQRDVRSRTDLRHA